MALICRHNIIVCKKNSIILTCSINQFRLYLLSCFYGGRNHDRDHQIYKLFLFAVDMLPILFVTHIQLIYFYYHPAQQFYISLLSYWNLYFRHKIVWILSYSLDSIIWRRRIFLATQFNSKPDALCLAWKLMKKLEC